MKLSPLFSFLLFRLGVAETDNASSRLLDESFLDPSLNGMVDMYHSFGPLSCNENMRPCVPFTTVYGTTRTAFINTEMVVPCGVCVIMDFRHPVLTLEHGLDIRGKLIIPDDYEITINTTSVLVQGVLEITSTKPVDGNPRVKFLLNNSPFVDKFIPIHNNRNVCPYGGCTRGKNSFTVAGGKVTMRGLPINTPTWLKLYDVDSYSSIIVDDSVRNKWAPGATIVITSNDQRYFGDQVRTIVSSSPAERGYVRLHLNETIDRPQALKDNVGFAVEVALLSRNILIEGKPDGHFWVLHTPKIAQTIEGVEFKSLGQAGVLGRYPIHLHMCGDLTGTRIAKNAVYNSNQRGIVLHGTNNVMIEENVAYNVKGHVFILEDGIETGNIFYKNIGIKTLDAKIVIPSSLITGNETDDQASTFWITNANNSWVGNVVAGSQSNGFWFELRIRGIRAHEFSHINPLEVPIVEFRDNEIHSVFEFGLRYYLFGYLPTTVQTFEGTKFCRNRLVALQLHRTRNLQFTHSYFSDNSIGVVIDRSEAIHFENATFIGYSAAFHDTVEANFLALAPCRHSLEGVRFQPANPFATDRSEPSSTGLAMKDVSFSEFSDGPCSKNFAIHLLPHRFTFSTFDMFTQFDRVFAEPNTIDFCDGVAIEAYDAYITDLTSSLQRGSSRPSTLVANTPSMLHFTTPSKCTENRTMCSAYCQDVCFRTVHYYLPQSESEGYSLRICDLLDPSDCIFAEGYIHLTQWPRRFTVHLPSGRKYDAVFVVRGEEVYPVDVEIVFERKLCPLAIDEDELILRSLPVGLTHDPSQSPTTFSFACSSLIKNGDIELGFAGYWKAFNSLSLYGTNGHNSNNAVGVTGRSRLWHGVSYNTDLIDRDCLEAGSKWRVTARLKLVNTVTGRGASCDWREGLCPVLDLSFRLGPSFEPVEMEVEGLWAATWDSSAFNLFEGYFTVPDYENIVHGIGMRFNGYPLDVDLIIDDFEVNRADYSYSSASVLYPPTISPTTFSQSSVCNILVDAFDEEEYVVDKWYSYGAGYVYATTPNGAVGYTGRDRLWNGLAFYMNRHADKDCMSLGSKWKVTAEIKLTDSVTGEGVSCEPSSITPGLMCPQMDIKIRDDNWHRRASNFRGFNSWNPNGFNDFEGHFQFPTEFDDYWHGNVRNIQLIVTDYPLETDVIVKNLIVRRLDVEDATLQTIWFEE